MSVAGVRVVEFGTNYVRHSRNRHRKRLRYVYVSPFFLNMMIGELIILTLSRSFAIDPVITASNCSSQVPDNIRPDNCPGWSRGHLSWWVVVQTAVDCTPFITYLPPFYMLLQSTRSCTVLLNIFLRLCMNKAFRRLLFITDVILKARIDTGSIIKYFSLVWHDQSISKSTFMPQAN